MTEQERSEILQVVQAPDAVYYLTVDYTEGDIGHAAGSVYRISGPRPADEVSLRVLATSDTPAAMWRSPAGSLWVGTADGRVATTASVGWPAAQARGNVVFDDEGHGLKWSVVSLPRVRGTNLPPNIQVLWGFDDDHVFVGADGGHVFEWRDRRWQQTLDGPADGDASVCAFGGSSPSNVFAVGRRSTVLHSDGSGWTRLPVPGADTGHETFAGVLSQEGGRVLICGAGDQGRLLQGTARGLVEFGRYDMPLIGMAPLEERVLFATGSGCAELVGRNVVLIKDTFQTVGVQPGIGRVFFIEPNQPYPGYVDYDPTQGDDAWWGVEF